MLFTIFGTGQIRKISSFKIWGGAIRPVGVEECKLTLNFKNWRK